MNSPQNDNVFSFSTSFGKTLQEYEDTSPALQEELSRIEESKLKDDEESLNLSALAIG